VNIDLNADLGEGAGADAELMRLVSSANVCGGLHAGGPADIRTAVELAVSHKVAVGAHPGYADREHFGRRNVELSGKELGSLLAYQIGAVQAVARLAGAAVKYVKPHGALYNRACRDAAVAGPVAGIALLHGLTVVGLPGSELERACAGKVPFVAEGFADRRYRPDGTLVPRTDADAFLHDPAEAVEQVERLIRDRGVRTVCVHGDNPAAVAFAAAVRAALVARGFEITSFV
jgi:UPF0271 protein